jgi:hypothetical protein
MIGIVNGINREITGLIKETINEIRNTTGITRLLYKPSLILACDIVWVRNCLFGLLI